VNFDNVDLIFKSYWTIRLDDYFVFISATKSTLLAHINQLRDLVWVAAINYWESVNRNQNFIALAVNSDSIVVVFVRCHAIETTSCWCKLDVYIFCDASRNHPLLGVPNLKILSLGWQNMQPLWRWANVYQSKFQRMSLISFETLKFYN